VLGNDFVGDLDVLIFHFIDILSLLLKFFEGINDNH
jgi:hypothetical protein